jgi:hypothetical protein
VCTRTKEQGDRVEKSHKDNRSKEYVGTEEVDEVTMTYVDSKAPLIRAGAIRGQVAKVLNSRELAINRGVEHGVAVEMLFDVLQSGGEDIEDPETGEVLGSVERPKVRVKIVEVYAKLSVASTYQTSEVNIGGSGGFGISTDLGRLLRPPKFVQKVQTLKTDEAATEEIRPHESFVKIGDQVVQVVQVVTEPADA